MFTWDDQVKAAKRVAKLMRPQKGSLILGSQVAQSEPGEYENELKRGSGTMYRHDQRSWQRLWELVGKEIGVDFRVKSTLAPYPKMKGMEGLHKGIFRMTFEVWRD